MLLISLYQSLSSNQYLPSMYLAASRVIIQLMCVLSQSLSQNNPLQGGAKVLHLALSVYSAIMTSS